MVGSFLSVINSNLNGINSHYKNRLANQMKNKIQVYVLYRRITLDTRTHINLKGKDCKTFHAYSSQRRVKIAVLISDKIHCKPKLLQETKKDTSYRSKSVHQEDITIVSTYTSNIRASKYRKQSLKNN